MELGHKYPLLLLIGAHTARGAYAVMSQSEVLLLVCLPPYSARFPLFVPVVSRHPHNLNVIPFLRVQYDSSTTPLALPHLLKLKLSFVDSRTESHVTRTTGGNRIRN